MIHRHGMRRCWVSMMCMEESGLNRQADFEGRERDNILAFALFQENTILQKSLLVIVTPVKEVVRQTKPRIDQRQSGSPSS